MVGRPSTSHLQVTTRTDVREIVGGAGFHERVTRTPRTVHTVTTKILKPVRAAAAGSSTALRLMESLPGFPGSGGVCGVAVAMAGEPWTSAFFDDRSTFGISGDGVRLFGPSPGSVAELLRQALARLPAL